MYLSLMRDAYDRSAHEYDQKFRRHQWPKYEALLGNQAQHLPQEAPRLLDVGCGTGLLAEFLREHGRSCQHYRGVDLSEQMLARAQARGLQVQQAQAARLPFEDQSFEAVTCFTVLRIMPSDEAGALREVARVLRPGGLLALSVLAKDDSPSLGESIRHENFEVLERVACGQDIGYRCRLAR
jgi:ubiquinone/menaquinone biosynthesis C-methylase UbiE